MQNMKLGQKGTLGDDEHAQDFDCRAGSWLYTRVKTVNI